MILTGKLSCALEGEHGETVFGRMGLGLFSQLGEHTITQEDDLWRPSVVVFRIDSVCAPPRELFKPILTCVVRSRAGKHGAERHPLRACLDGDPFCGTTIGVDYDSVDLTIRLIFIFLLRDGSRQQKQPKEDNDCLHILRCYHSVVANCCYQALALVDNRLRPNECNQDISTI